MTDREKAGLRGAVRRVVSESFRADWQTKAMPEKAVTQETAYLPDGRLQEQRYQAPNGHESKATYIKYDDHGNWTEQTDWTRVEPGQEEFPSMLVKRTLT